MRSLVDAMRNFALNPERLVAVCNNLGDAVIDPTLWPQIMDDICAAAGATGAAPLQTDIRTPDIPLTTSVDDCFKYYFATYCCLAANDVQDQTRTCVASYQSADRDARLHGLRPSCDVIIRRQSMKVLSG